MSRSEEVKRTLTFARDLADPDWSLSVPRPAKVVIANLSAAVEAVLSQCDYLDTLADGDKHYAARFRKLVENALTP